MKKHTILFLAANPGDSDRLALDQEARSIQVELERTGHRDQLQFETRWAAEPLDLLRELRKLRPSVVHYSGHGGRDGLFFQTPDGRVRLVSAAAVAETFGAAGASVKLVVLSACYGDEHADALLAHVDCVVGMSGSTPDVAARSFAIGFYGGLGESESVATAYEQGCAAISLETVDELDGYRRQARDAGELVRRSIARERPCIRTRPGVDASQITIAVPSVTPPASPTRPGLIEVTATHRGTARQRRLWFVAAGAIAVIAGGFHVAAVLDREAPGAAARRDPERSAAILALSAPPGMVQLPAIELDLGSTDDEIAGAFAWCRALTHPAQCRRDLYERERPLRHARLPALWFDTRERSTGDLATWLSSLSGLREEDGWLVAGHVRLAQAGEDRDLRIRGATIIPRPGTEQLPAIDVTYDGARRFCQAHGLDLPTEAQWERAARGGERRRFPWGDLEPTCDRATYGRGPGGPCSSGTRAPVGARTGDRTPEGVANLGGNVAEWTIDRYVDGDHAACPTPCTDPVVEATDAPHELHVIRGGGFASLAEQLRGAGRARAPRDAAFGDTGFRCAKQTEARRP